MTDRPRNPPGRDMLAGRLGTRATFMARMQQRLAHWRVDSGPSEGEAPLRGLSPLEELLPSEGASRSAALVSGNDFTHGLLDGWAVVADVLCFYQERILNEGYLRTATEDFSVVELVAALDEQPAPPVAARVDLSFSLSDKAGAPEELVLAAGLAVQSVPGPDGKPQGFETSTPLRLRSEWNAMVLSRPRPPTGPAPLRADAHALLLTNGTHGVRPGDVLLLAGRRADGSAWRVLQTVRRVGRSRRRGCSLVAWDEPLDATLGTEALSGVEVWTTRAPELLFGATARPWAELRLEDQLRLGTPWGGLLRLDAAWSQWTNLRRGLPLGTLLCLGASGGHLLASVEGHGLLRSQDAGDTWAPVPLPTSHMDVLCLGQDTQGRILAGTRRHGMLRSADGGGSWEQLKGQITVEPPALSLGRNARKDLRLPLTPVRAVAAFVSGEGDSAAAFLLAGTDEGLFCFEEATATWRPYNEGLPLGKSDDSRVPVSVRAIVADPTRATFLIATSHGVFFTRRLGDRWEPRNPGRAGQPALTALVDEQGRLFVTLEDGTLYRSVDGGKTYAPVTPKAEAGAVAVRAVSLGVPARGAPAPLLAATSHGAFVSHDGGTSWVTPPLTDPVEVTALAEVAPFQLVATTPLLGVKEKQWPNWRLTSGQLDLARVMPRLSPGQPLVLEQVGESQTVRRDFLTLSEVLTVSQADFEQRQLVSRVRVEPGAAVVDYDRGTARVRPAGLLLPLLDSQVRSNLPLHQGGTLDAMLDQDDTFDVLVREPRDSPPDTGEWLRVEGALPDPTGRVVLVEGRRMRVRVPPSALAASLPPLLSDDGVEQAAPRPGELLEVLARPDPSKKDASGRVTWRLRTEHGVVGTAAFAPDALTLVPSQEDGESAVERRVVVEVAPLPGATGLRLDRPLEELLDPASVLVHGNTVEATHGLTVIEVLGSGDATRVFQGFRLKRSPLVWLATAEGPAPAIEVKVGGRTWHRARNWSGQGPDSHVYVLRQASDGTTLVVFGDGLRGARLPTGQENVTATYRVGGGPEGNVEAGRVRMLRQRPLGLRAVVNPLPASGGTAAESSDSLRTRAPLRVRTLDRIVSPRDFEDFVRTYPGVARVRARQVWKGHEHILFLTVATQEEQSQHRLLPGSALEVALRQALERFRSSTHTVDLGSYEPVAFELAATLTVDPDFDGEQVADSARKQLAAAYAFERRELARAVAASDVPRLLSDVPGVLNVNLTTLRRRGATAEAVPALLPAGDIHWDARLGRVRPAEMLLLDVKTGLSLTVEPGP